jgi:hypothetical protein
MLVSSSSLEIDCRIREWIIADIVEKTREILPVGVTLARSNKRWVGRFEKCSLISQISDLFSKDY